MNFFLILFICLHCSYVQILNNNGSMLFRIRKIISLGKNAWFEQHCSLALLSNVKAVIMTFSEDRDVCTRRLLSLSMMVDLFYKYWLDLSVQILFIFLYKYWLSFCTNMSYDKGRNQIDVDSHASSFPWWWQWRQRYGQIIHQARDR